MPKNSNSKKPKPVEVKKENPISTSSSKPKKPSNEIDEIFAGKKRKLVEIQEKSSGEAVTEAKKVKKGKGKSSRMPKDGGLLEPPRRQRKKTADGFSLYTEEELGIGRSDAGGTPLCPFDCDCCF
ncbi:putative protein C6G9.01c [Capsicum galapagoense]